MSSFLSDKFLKYRAQLGRKPQAIDRDVFCATCGYNVRGLTYGRNCPECGSQIVPVAGLEDVLVSGDWSERQRTYVGLALVAGCLIGVALARGALFIGLIFTGIANLDDAYLWLGTAMSIAWIAGVLMMTDRRLDAPYPRLRWMRIWTRRSQVLWLPAYGLWLIAAAANQAGNALPLVYAASVVLRGAAAVGAFGFAILLMRIAEDAGLERAARRINLAIWMLPLPTLILALIPSTILWISLFLVAIPLLIWCWYVLVWGRAVLEMERHVSWALRLAADAPRRLARMAETRRELDEDVAARVRPTPKGPAEDLPLMPRE